jgi:putative copper export protein
MDWLFFAVVGLFLAMVVAANVHCWRARRRMTAAERKRADDEDRRQGQLW